MLPELKAILLSLKEELRMKWDQEAWNIRMLQER
jgi:hypothetical protein